MTFTEEQIKTLSTWESNFHTAINADWARNPGTSGLRVIYDIYTKVTGDKRPFNDNCSHCIVSLLRDCGKIYFQDKEILAKRKSSSKQVKASQEEREPVRKARIKTTRKNAV